MKYIFGSFIVLLFLSSCNNKQNNRYESQGENENQKVSVDSHPGKALMETHCYVCHAPSKQGNAERIAPPMENIQKYYITEATSKEAFLNEFMAFMEKPSQEKAKMKGAVEEYGLMPYQKFPQDALDKIADFLYETSPLKNNASAEKLQQEKSESNNNQKTKEEIGLEYALSTKQLLGQNLMGTIQQKGTLKAVEFCNIEAMPLTKQMQEKHNALIKRVSDKYRNPENAANQEEQRYINHFKEQISKGNDPSPVVLAEGNKTRFYYPIVTNTMCLQCHGKPEKMDVKVLNTIQALYTNDLATGYEENEVRGIWSMLY